MGDMSRATDGPGVSEEVEVTITAYPDGPYLVRGSYRIVDIDGNELDSDRRTVALCRCGRSGQKPWCDGSHATANFRDHTRAPRPDPPSQT